MTLGAMRALGVPAIREEYARLECERREEDGCSVGLGT